MQQAETLLEMGDRFKVSQSRCGIPPRLQPLIDRAFGVAGSRQVMSEQLRLALDEIGEMPFQRRRDARVQLLPDLHARPCEEKRSAPSAVPGWTSFIHPVSGVTPRFRVNHAVSARDDCL